LDGAIRHTNGKDLPPSAVLDDVKWVPVFLILSFALTSAAPKTLRVFCWNIHHGVGMDGKLDLTRIAKVIREAKPDLVALQEVDKNCRRSGKIDQAEELAKLTGMQASYGKAMDFDGGEYGQAILSQKLPQLTKIHRLPGTGEPRIAFEAQLSIESLKLSFATVHLDLDATQRIHQIKSSIQAFDSPNSPPLILCGDFNADPASPEIKNLSTKFSAVAKNPPTLTCPADKPDTEIDHVFLRALEPAGPVIVTPEAIASDHRPLLFEVKLPERN
jgi:endonuclease/exonuclease/phosphatase family metal-dependent hydrolase